MQKIYLLAKHVFINGIIYYNDPCIELFFAEVSCHNKISYLVTTSAHTYKLEKETLGFRSHDTHA